MGLVAANEGALSTASRARSEPRANQEQHDCTDGEPPLVPGGGDVCSDGWHYLSNATWSNAASFVICVFPRFKDHHNLLHYSPRLKKTCVRQVLLDKWFPLSSANIYDCGRHHHHPQCFVRPSS